MTFTLPPLVPIILTPHAAIVSRRQAFLSAHIPATRGESDMGQYPYRVARGLCAIDKGELNRRYDMSIGKEEKLAQGVLERGAFMSVGGV